VKPFARAAALIAALSLLSACSGGGGHASPLAPMPAPSGTVAAAASARGTVTIKFATVHKLSASARRRLHASAASMRARSQAKRKPQFVDPYGDYFEIFDESYAGAAYSANTSMTADVAPGYDGTQTLTASLITGDSYFQVLEYDDNDVEIAYGAIGLSGTSAGSNVPISLTLAMQPVGIAITSDIQYGEDATALSTDPNNPTSWGNTCPQSYEASYLLAYDDADSYELGSTLVGSGGIPVPSIVSQSSENGGTSRISSTIGGGLYILPDDANDPINAHMQILDASGNVVNDQFNNPINGYLLAAQYDTNCG
jgi:hypothetical protein